MPLPLPDILISEDDFETLCDLLASAPPSARLAADRLDAELARARIVPAAELPADVVALGTRVIVEELTSDVRRVITLVLPRDADADEGRISVLSPVGSALLGLRTGQVIEWSVPARPKARFCIAAVLHQPAPAPVSPSARSMARGGAAA
ncbi:MAG: nucleoside diphosphate kinase regulator [Sandaracinaceae bacterium]|nr:nucleoside diphosphate kinase regulator [Sandaracinaceae bacterium]